RRVRVLQLMPGQNADYAFVRADDPFAAQESGPGDARRRRRFAAEPPRPDLGLRVENFRVRYLAHDAAGMLQCPTRLAPIDGLVNLNRTCQCGRLLAR